MRVVPEKPLCRPREWRALERGRERRKRRDNWLRKGGFDTVIFVPATPGTQLKRGYMRERSKPQILRSRLLSNQGQPLKPCYKGQTPVLMPTAFEFPAGLTGTDLATVWALHMYWFARLVNRNMSEKSPGERILAGKNTSICALERREESSVM